MPNTTETLRQDIASTIVLGSFPPPVHGAAVVNAFVADRLLRGGRETLHLETGRSNIGRTLASSVARIVRVAGAMAKCIFLPWPHGTIAYIGLNGGPALFYDVLVAATLRVRRIKLLLFHHSTAWLDKPSIFYRLLVKVAGEGAVHGMCSVTMAEQFKQAFDIASHVHVVDNSAFVPCRDRLLRQPILPIALGCLSNLSVAKGVLEVIAAFRRCNEAGIECHLHLAGPTTDPAARAAVQKVCADYPEFTKYHGYVSGLQKDKFFDNIDVFLFPSTYPHETQSLVVIEALARGIPVIAYDHRYVAELIPDGGGVIVSRKLDFADAVVNAVRCWQISPERLRRASLAALDASRARQRTALLALDHFLGLRNI